MAIKPSVRDRETVAQFDGRLEVKLRLSAFGNEDVNQTVVIAYEFGYALVKVRHGPYSQIRMEFMRDDTDHARRRAQWSTHCIETQGAWSHPPVETSTPPYLGPRIDPQSAAQARRSLVIRRDRGAEFRFSLLGAGFLILIGWLFRDSVVVAASLVALSVLPLATWVLSPYFTRSRTSRDENMIRLFDLQQNIERGFISPPPPGDVRDSVDGH